MLLYETPDSTFPERYVTLKKEEATIGRRKEKER